MYVVAGVSGNTGAVVADVLLAHGEKVRVLVRDAAKGAAWSKKGAEVAVVELSDAAGLAQALAGAQGAYLLVPPQYQAEDMFAAQGPIRDALVHATVESRIPHVVLLSSLGAQHASGTGPIRSLHVTEQAFRAAGSNVTFLRAAYFMENWASVLDEAQANGALMTFLTAGARVHMVATRDIGRAAVDALLEPVKGVRVIELLGPAAYAPEDVAAQLGTVLDREVKASVGPLEYVVPTLTALGFTAGTAESFREMIGGINSGHVAPEGGSAICRLGTLTPADVFRALLVPAKV